MRVWIWSSVRRMRSGIYGYSTGRRGIVLHCWRSMAAPSPDQQPTHARYGAVAFGVALSFITYIDRVAISQAAPAIAKELRLTTLQMGYVFSAFGLTYALLEI